MKSFEARRWQRAKGLRRLIQDIDNKSDYVAAMAKPTRAWRPFNNKMRDHRAGAKLTDPVIRKRQDRWLRPPRLVDDALVGRPAHAPAKLDLTHLAWRRVQVPGQHAAAIL